MDDIDDVLKRLAAAPVPIRLTAIDERVWFGITSHRRDDRSFTAAGAIVAVGAVAMGVAVGGFGSPEATAAPAPLSLTSPLAPSTLLAGVK